MHPSQELLGQKSDKLSGNTIVLGLTGSIAVVESIKLIHELIRHGAEVIPVMTKAATEIIDPQAVLYASGKTPITKITGEIEHVTFCGQTETKADLVLIAPCTANTISKIANGIDDTTVTTFATTAIGSKIPIILLPAMHSSMYEHPVIKENINKLEKMKINLEFIEPIRAENKYKMPSLEDILAKVIRKLWKNDLRKKKVLIIAGATAEKIDEIRVLTNRSSGNTGIALAEQAYLRGADVTLWLGNSQVNSRSIFKTERFQSVSDLESMVAGIKGTGKYFYDVIIVCAAISDYTPNKPQQGKIGSDKSELKLTFKPTQKIIPEIKKRSPQSILIGFKAESGIEQRTLINRGRNRMNKWDLSMIVANDLKKVSNDDSEVLIIKPKRKPKKISGKKQMIAEKILDEILNVKDIN